MNILFITWDGPEVSYLESLFLPIFNALKNYGYNFHVLQFGWGNSDCKKRRELACQELKIPYRYVSVIRSPKALGSVLTAWQGSKK